MDDHNLYIPLFVETPYYDRKSGMSRDNYFDRLGQTTTVYLQGCRETTREEQIYSLFSKCGFIKRLVMGLFRQSKTPAGFAFVEFWSRENAEKSVNLFDQSKLDGRIISVALDVGFKEGRQYKRY